MEEDAEMGEDSTSRVSMRAAGGTFIAGTAELRLLQLGLRSAAKMLLSTCPRTY